MNTQDQNSATRSPRRELETFNNPNPGRDYSIRIRIPEFTCLCPKTGQPDFATLFLDYIPEAACVELKSLKQYVWSYRDEGAFHEAITNAILADLVEATHPGRRLDAACPRNTPAPLTEPGLSGRLI